MQLDDVHDTSLQSKSAKLVEESLVFFARQKTAITSMDFRNPSVILACVAITSKVLATSTKVTL